MRNIRSANTSVTLMLNSFEVKQAVTENVNPAILGLFRKPEGVTVHAILPLHTKWTDESTSVVCKSCLC